MRGDERFDEFYQGGYRRLVGQVFLLTGDLHDAEDIAQEAFTRAAARWEQIRGHDVPAAWVRRVAINLATDAARRARRRLAALSRLGEPAVVPARWAPAWTTCTARRRRSTARAATRRSTRGSPTATVARIRMLLSDGRSVDLPAPQLQLIRGTSVKFWAFNPRACVDLVRISAYGADGRLLAEREERWFFTTDARGVDLSTTMPYRSTQARPSDTARVVDLRFGASLPARERTSILVALEERGAHIILRDGDRRYGLEHVIPEHWEAVRTRLNAERAAGRLTYTVGRSRSTGRRLPRRPPARSGHHRRTRHPAPTAERQDHRHPRVP